MLKTYRAELWSDDCGIHTWQYCDMHLILDACNCWADPRALKCVLCYHGWHRPDAVFQLSEQCHLWGWRTTPATLVSSWHLQTEHQPMKMPLLWVCKESCREARNLTVPADSLWSFVWWWFAYIQSITEVTSVDRQLFSVDAVFEWLQHDMQRVSSYCTKFCGHMEYYWHVRVCWAITTVMSGHIKSFMHVGTWVWSPLHQECSGLYYQQYLYVCWLLSSNFLETVLPWLLEDVPWLWGGGFGFVTLELQHSMGRMSFTGKWIGHGGFIAWPPWLLDLTLPDFFPTRTCKAHVKPSPPQGYQVSHDKNIGSSDIGHCRHTNPHVAGIQCRVYFAKAGNLNGHCYFAWSSAHCTLTSYTRSLSCIWMPCSILSSTLKWT